MKEYQERCKAEKLADTSSNSSDTSQSAQLETTPTAPHQAQTAIPQEHHHIAASNKSFFSLPEWLKEHQGDPALTVRHPITTTFLLDCHSLFY